MPKVTVMVGGSIGCASIASVTETSANVSATVALVMPAMETISPGSAKSIAVCSRPRKPKILVQRKFSIKVPSTDIALID